MVACPKEIAWKIGTETKQKIRKLFTKETYWHKGIRVSYGFGGKYWKFDLIVNNLMDRLQEDFGLPEALSKIESSQNAEKEYDEYMKVFERIKQFMIQNESIEPECIENYGMIFQASDI